MGKCAYCGSEVPDGTNFCGFCGAPLNHPFEASENNWDFDRTAEQSGWEQAQTGWDMSNQAGDAGYGYRNQQNYQQPNYQQPNYGYYNQQQYGDVPYSEKSKVAAGILGILLGALGIHKFYLGYTSTGVIMLLVSILTLGFGAAIMGIIGLVEGIIYLTKSDEEFYYTYVENQKKWF